MTNGVAAAREFDVTAQDGRNLHAYEAGDPNGELVIYHHGTPGSGILSQSWHELAAARAIRLVGFDRAGYGGSDRHPGRRVVDAAADTAAVADALQVGQFRTWGFSGGGPHVLACAARLGGRVVSAASLASCAPYDAPGLDFLIGMGQDNIDEFGAAIEGAGQLAAYLEPSRRELMAASSEDIGQALASLLSDVDKEALTGDVASFLHVGIQVGLRAGYDGWLDDDLAFVGAWGFEVGSIGVPMLVMQGEQDLMVPPAHGRWIASQLPTAEVRLSASDGHLTLPFHQLDDVYSWLLNHS